MPTRSLPPHKKTARPPLKGAGPVGKKLTLGWYKELFNAGWSDCCRRNWHEARCRLRCSVERARSAAGRCNLGRSAAARCNSVRCSWGAGGPREARSSRIPAGWSPRRASWSGNPAEARRASAAGWRRYCCRPERRSVAIHPASWAWSQRGSQRADCPARPPAAPTANRSGASHRHHCSEGSAAPASWRHPG